MRKLSKAIEFRTQAATFDRGKSKPLVLVITPQCVGYRVQRGKQTFHLTHEAIYQLAVKAEVDSHRTRPAPIRRSSVGIV